MESDRRLVKGRRNIAVQPVERGSVYGLNILLLKITKMQLDGRKTKAHAIAFSSALF